MPWIVHGLPCFILLFPRCHIFIRHRRIKLQKKNKTAIFSFPKRTPSSEELESGSFSPRPSLLPQSEKYYYLNIGTLSKVTGTCLQRKRTLTLIYGHVQLSGNDITGGLIVGHDGSAKQYDTLSQFPTIGDHRFTYVDKSTGRSYAWNDTEGEEGYYCIGSDYKRVEFVRSSL